MSILAVSTFAQLIQPVFIVESVDSKFKDVNDFVFTGKPVSSDECGIFFYNCEDLDYCPLNILYKGRMISVYPEHDLGLKKFLAESKSACHSRPRWFDEAASAT